MRVKTRFFDHLFQFLLAKIYEASSKNLTCCILYKTSLKPVEWDSCSVGTVDDLPVGLRFISDWVDCVPGSVAADSSLRFLSIGWSPR